MKKLSKNYFRNELINLSEELRSQPTVFTAKYKHTDSPIWATFTTVRRYVPGEKQRTVCQHINLERRLVSPHLRLTILEHNRKVYIRARISSYSHYGDTRGCLNLDVTKSEPAVWLAPQSAGAKSAARLRAASGHK